MGRPYAVKGRKKKRKLEDGEASHASPAADEAEELPPLEEDETEKEEVTEGLPVVPGRWTGSGGPARSSCSRGSASRSAKSARLCKS